MVRILGFLTLIITVLFFGPGTFAQSDLSKSFQTESLSIPEALQKQGYTGFAMLNLARLIKEIKERDVTPDENLGYKNGNGRITGRWERRGGNLTISINPWRWFHAPYSKYRSGLALHEHLMASGFVFEEFYRLSIPMWLLASEKYKDKWLPEHRSWLEEVLRSYAYKKIKLAGGSVGVGGGGEIDTIGIRLEQVENEMERYIGAKSKRKKRDIFKNVKSWVLSKKEIRRMERKR